MEVSLVFLIPLACIVFGIYMARGHDQRIGAIAILSGFALVAVILVELNIYLAVAYLALWAATIIGGWRLEKRRSRP
ncbi:hypothetical protein HY379_02265 [Candidatus Saccharibacteria bacterium]|nr:hypothetical protein [Candidatus Saccharibacteria bacterium]